MKGERWRQYLGGLLCAASVLACATAFAQNKPGTGGKRYMYCWKDGAGPRSCASSIPPDKMGKQKIEKVDGATGVVIKTYLPELTEDQRRMRADEERRQASDQKIRAQQDAYDRALLATYARPEELAALRDDRLESLDISIDLNESATRRDSVSVAELRSRLSDAGSDGKPNAKLARDIAKFEASLADNQRVVSEQHRNREKLCSQFARDIQRFQELKSGSVSYTSPCPPPGSFAPKDDQQVDLAGARNFFDRYVELEHEGDPTLFDLYADTALMKTTRVGADGKSVNEEQKFAKVREALTKQLPLNKQNRLTPTYSDIKLEPGSEGRAMIRGKRMVERDGVAVPFYFVVKSGNKGWRIVETWVETPPSS